MAKAKAAPKTGGGDGTVHIQPVQLEGATLRIIGTTPLFQNSMSEKVKQGLLVGSKKKTAAEKVQIKHDPISEFRNSMEMVPDGPTALGIRMTALKAAMCDAALETAGLTKASAQRLLFLPGDHATLWGVPMLRMDVTRSADMNRTPDVRTRAFLPTWAAELQVHYVTPQLNASAVATLLTNAGILIGVGDFRQQKGKGAYGAFRLFVDGQDDDLWDRITKAGGRAEQLAAIEDPQPADKETASLLDHWKAERQRRS